jgi:murein DD-endopeptidase MepM/ murein hydrolase activator NlpD
MAQQIVTVRTTAFDKAAYPGNVVRLTITCRCDAERAEATVFKQDVPLSRTADGWQGLIGIDLDTKPGTYAVSVSVEPRDKPAVITTRHALVIKPKQFPVRRLSVAPQFVEPPVEEVERIQRDAALLQSIFESVDVSRHWRGPFRTPMDVTPSSNFGSRSVFNGQPRSPHAGVDFGARIGTPISAPAAGAVVLAEPLYFTGNTVVIDHGLGLYSLLAHLSEFRVVKGANVSGGETVGLVGDTGRVTGAHLHWSVRLNGARVDPLSLIAATKN